MAAPWLVDVLGVGAALCSMGSFAPQLVKLWRERDASAISLRMYMVTVAGFILWTLYGLVIGRWPIAASNLVCLAMSAAILILKFRFDAGKPRR
ncbi:MAG TPA: SemiSWEET transporter [Caulobacteraceae bacterium]|nr:SemiSWEET transporter [Caulobacteraceae bacterium]